MGVAQPCRAGDDEGSGHAEQWEQAEAELAGGGPVPYRGRGGVVRAGGAPARGARLLPQLPGAHRVPRARAGPPGRVRGVGRDDRAATPCAAAGTAGGDVVGGAVDGRAAGARRGATGRGVDDVACGVVIGASVAGRSVPQRGRDVRDDRGRTSVAQWLPRQPCGDARGDRACTSVAPRLTGPPSGDARGDQGRAATFRRGAGGNAAPWRPSRRSWPFEHRFVVPQAAPRRRPRRSAGARARRPERGPPPRPGPRVGVGRCW